jgi:ribosomal protein S1
MTSPGSSPSPSVPPHDLPAGAPAPAASHDKPDLDREVDQALGGLSIEQLMEQSTARPPAAGGGGGGARLDPARPVRGGRPGPKGGGRDRHHDQDHVNPDNIKRGKVVAIREGNAFVDIGGKSQGICPLDQFDQVAPTDDAGDKKGVEVGQEYDFIYKGYDAREGLVILARKGAVQHGAWETLSAGDTVEAVVTGVNKGGLELKVGTTRAFMPAGQVDTKFHQDLSVFLNQKMPVRVIKVDREDHNILLSRRAILEEEEAKKADQTWGELAVGQVREGTVRSVQPYGAFIDLGGVDGLLHVSAMSHQRVADPKKLLKEGDKLQVMVINLDKDKKRVSLSLKQLTKDPWDTVQGDFPVGTTVDGTVKKVVEFGAFVELAPGVEGLVHVSQLALKRVGRPGEVVKEGDKVKAKVQGIDTEKRRISLSMAEAERDAKVASGELKPEEAAPAAGKPGGMAGGAPAAAAAPRPGSKPRKNLKGGL